MPLFFFLWLYNPLDLGRFSSFLILYIVGTAPWTVNLPVARPLPTHRTNAYTLYASSGIRTHDPSVRAGEDGSCLGPRGQCDRLQYRIPRENLLHILIKMFNRVKLT
jgi:hypothetical protein